MSRNERDDGAKLPLRQVGVLVLVALLIGVACWLAWTLFEAIFLIRFRLTRAALTNHGVGLYIVIATFTQRCFAW